MFKADYKSKKMNKEKASVFSTFAIKGMLVCNRGMQDIQPGISFLATRVLEPNENDWKK